MVIKTVHTRNASIIIIFKVQAFRQIFEEEESSTIFIVFSSDIGPKVSFLNLIYTRCMQGFILCQHVVSPQMVW